MTAPATDIQQLAINTIRILSIDAVQNADSGHPGLPMGAAAMAYVLWTKHLRHNPANPSWPNRDRFILSAGHGSMLLYSLLHLTGYDLSLDEIKDFRQLHSKTPGHPEYGETPGVETTSGPLGQGLATSVGFALAEVFLADKFNTPEHKVIDHYTYVIASDGDMMEGLAIEASALAGHWGLGKLIVLYDDNQVTLDGDADIAFSEDIPARYRAQGWHTLSVRDGNDPDAIDNAIEAAKTVTDQPSLIAVRTVIGYGSPNKAGSSEAHGKALGAEEVRLVKEGFGWPSMEPFYLPEAAVAHFREALTWGKDFEDQWNQTFAAWRAANPDAAQEWGNAWTRTLPAGWDADLPRFSSDKRMATRNAGGEALNAIAKHFPTMIGGDADLAGSTKTLLKGEAHTALHQPAARNVRFGVREHGMGAIVNGLALHGGIIKPYSATFLQFSDYMRGAVRIGALMDIPTVYIYTHDSIGLGEDGPTHQPVEHVMALRAIPNLHVFRPADANETVGAWRAIMRLNHPAALILSRQDLPVLGDDDDADANIEGIYEGVERGAYVLAETSHVGKGTPEVIILSTGSEVSIALDALDALDEAEIKARVVSMPSWELFDAQDDAYQQSVLPDSVPLRVSLEAGVTLGWHKYVGTQGIAIGVDTFGASAPYQDIYEAYGITAKAVVEAAAELLERFGK